MDADPLFAGAVTHLFVVPDIAALEATGQGMLLERRGSRGVMHQNLLLEARFDAHAFAARAMLDAALSLPGRGPGAHAYTFALRSRSR